MVGELPARVPLVGAVHEAIARDLGDDRRRGDRRARRVTTDDGAEFQHLVLMNLADGKRQVVAKTNWDVDKFNLSDNRARLAYVTNENGVDRQGALDVITMLLDRGVDVNARVKEFPPMRRYLLPLASLEWVDFTGQTAFIRAAQAGDLPVMKLLLSRGADPKITTFNGTTALMAAAGVNWVVGETFSESTASLPAMRTRL